MRNDKCSAIDAETRRGKDRKHEGRDAARSSDGDHGVRPSVVPRPSWPPDGISVHTHRMVRSFTASRPGLYLY